MWFLNPIDLFTPSVVETCRNFLSKHMQTILAAHLRTVFNNFDRSGLHTDQFNTEPFYVAWL